MNTDRRSFVKGLFLAASAPLIGSIPLVTHANEINFASVKVYYTYLENYPNHVEFELNAKNDASNIFRNYIKYQLNWLNATTPEYNDDEWRFQAGRSATYYWDEHLFSRRIKRYGAHCDERNNTPSMIYNGAKRLETYVAPYVGSGFITFDFGFDPQYA